MILGEARFTIKTFRLIQLDVSKKIYRLVVTNTSNERKNSKKKKNQNS